MIPNLYFLVWGRKFKPIYPNGRWRLPTLTSQLPGEIRPDS
jgi:hypothetical protein